MTTHDRADWIGAVALVICACGIFFVKVPAYPLLGWDSYPEILTSRILDLADFVGTFTEQTSEGFHPSAFYRPLLNLSLAADYALWGLEPLGYHLTTVLLLGGCGLALFWLSRCLLGAGARYGPWATLLIFLLAPVQTEIIPLISRRMDILCGLFSVLALATQTLRIRRPTPVAGVVPALFTALSVGSKEAGVALVPLIFTLALFLLPEERFPRRSRFAARVALHHGVAVALVFAARFAAIGGLGGHPTTDPSEILTRLPLWLGLTVTQIASAWPVTANADSSDWLYAVSAISLLSLTGLSLFVLRQREVSRGIGPESLSELTTIAIAGIWIVLLAGIYAVTGLLRPWHLFLPMMGFALLVGAVVQRLIRIHEIGRGASRKATVAALAGIALWVALVARYSPLLIGFGHWDLGAQKVGPYLEELRLQIEQHPSGGYFEMPMPPQVAPGNPSPIKTDVATWVNAYSLPAWAELRFPGRSIEFRRLSRRAPAPRPEADVLLIGIRAAR
ncbi:MAG: hypothetical protein JRH19_01075 [Deltaproteobacteria bacterium]|nr:hypothetical protein [Deltaproteobacteria bacterium]